MKRLLVRASAKVGRFFWSWGFLKFVLWTTTLIVFLYVEEDWRGARAWSATKAKWEARGESFDFNRLIPPPVPDDQNLAALPFFKMEPDPEHQRTLAPLALRNALRINHPGGELLNLSVGDWTRGKSPDLSAIRNGVETAYTETFKTAPAGQDELAQFDALFPCLADLRQAAVTRPYLRFQSNYRSLFYDGYLSLFTAQTSLSKILTLHAILALDDHQPGVALDDLQLNFRIASGLREQPLLVSNLCGMGVTSIGLQALRNGLALHSWNEAQLASLQKQLASIDYLGAYQRAVRGEAVGMMVPAFDEFKLRRHTSYWSELNARNAGDFSKSKASDNFPHFWADGWIDWMKVQAIDLDLNSVQFVDPGTRMAFPGRVNRFAKEMAGRQDGWSHRIWHMLTDEAAGPLVAAAQHFAEGQVYIDEATIACALERYRLGHGVHPESLSALDPEGIESLPHDILNGQPYHYQIHPDGTYFLYSVGWNLTDDGGQVVRKRESPLQIDYDRGDWVWFGPK